MPDRNYLALWEFHVKPDAISTFEGTYGPNGAWAQLFRQSPDYLGMELVRDLNRPGRYLTLDRWTSREAPHSFKQVHQAAYTALDKQCERLTEKEIFLGDFETIASDPET
ncbi:MAG: antibiotic biosynthesis monooxygenase [Terriglobales bacterium]